MAKVVELNSFPVKGCAGSPLTHAVATPMGLEHDRSFMVVDEQSVFRSQRRDQRLALIHPAVRDHGAVLTLAADGFDPAHIDIDTTSARRSVELFSTPYTGIDQGEIAAQWLSEVLGKPSRLVRVPPEHDRVVAGYTTGRSGYADSSALHLTTTESLAELNRRIDESGRNPVAMSRFRPNIVVDGFGAAHEEDTLRRVAVGDADLAFSKLAIRCAVALIDQPTARKAGPEPLRTLASYRRAADGGVAFGVKFAVSRPGKVSLGDTVEVVAWGDAEL